MNLKKMSALVTSGLLFLIVLMVVINTVSIISKKSKEKVAMILNYKIKPKDMVASYNYLEIKVEPVKEEKIEDKKEVEQPKEEEIDTAPLKDEAIYVGKITAYGADCAGCSGLGNLACPTKNGNKYSLANDGEYYSDSEFGSIRIIAADLSKFPCGTVVKITHNKLGEFYAVVLDTGASMQNASARGEVWMDLAFKTESDPEIYSVTSSNTTFAVQRWGW